MGDKLHTIFSYLRHRISATGGGHGIHSPFAYQLCENVFYSSEPFYDFEKLKRIRQQLLKDKTILDTGNFGAGSRVFSSGRRKVSDIARKGVTTSRQSHILYKLANYLGIKTCIELGTSIGLNTLYLALQSPSGKVITIEGSSELSGFAKSLAQSASINNAEYLVGKFEEVLPSVVVIAEAPVLVYIDGDHRQKETLRLFELLAPLATGNNVFVFDDIYWSTGMTAAWKKICADKRVTLAVDTFDCGYVFFRPEIKEKVISRITL